MPPCDTPAQNAPIDLDPGLRGPDDLGLWFGAPEEEPAEAPARVYHHADMTLGEVLRAVPPDSRPVRDQLQALRAGLACPALADEKPKFRHKLEQFWRVHVLHASWGGPGRPPRGVSSPGRRRVCELVLDPNTSRPISVTMYKRLRRWWTRHGYLAIVREGWTPDIAPWLLHDRDHNTTQAYVLCVPTRAARRRAMLDRRSGDHTKNGPLSVFSNTGASLTREEGKTGDHSPASCCYPSPAGSPGTRESSPRTEWDRWPGLLGRLTEGWRHHLTTRFLDAGYTRIELLYLLDRKPDGSQFLGTDEQVGNVSAVVRWRLAHWIRDDGTVIPSPSAEDARRARETQHRRRAEHGIREADALRSAEDDLVTPAADTAFGLLADSPAKAASLARRAAAREPATPPTAAASGPQRSAAARRTADDVMAAILARRAAQRPPQPPGGATAGDPAVGPPPSAAPLPAWWQEVVDQMSAAAKEGN